jgi:hypothetical protein
MARSYVGIITFAKALTLDTALHEKIFTGRQDYSLVWNKQQDFLQVLLGNGAFFEFTLQQSSKY